MSQSLPQPVVLVALTRGLFAQIDEADCDLVAPHLWRADPARNTFYASTRLRRPTGERWNLRMHRLIAGAAEGQEVDHVNGNGLDNRRSNLRICTHPQNTQNQHRIRGRSRFQGVSWDRRRRAWYAKIGDGRGGRAVHLGTFATEEEAARAYNAAALRVYGPDAKLNPV